MKQIKISYQKRWDMLGYVYDQRINSLSMNDLNVLNSQILREISLDYPRRDKYTYTNGDAECFLKPITEHIDNLYFTNHTQRNFINLFLKLPLKDRNTSILIK